MSSQQVLDQLPPGSLMRELISSIRDIRIRIDEVKEMISEGYCIPERKNELADRILRMKETKMMLMHSAYDVRKPFIESLGQHMKKSVVDQFSAEKMYDLMRDV